MKQAIGAAACVSTAAPHILESACFALSCKAMSALVDCELGAYMNPLQICVDGKQRTVKRGTMPKLFEPPLRARQRSGCDKAVAVTILP